MNARRTLLVVMFLFSTSIGFAFDEKGEIFVADLDRLDHLDLSLEGADYYYWLTPIKGHVLLNRQCVPTETDCDHNVVVVWDENGRKIFERAPFLDVPDMSGGTIFAATLIGVNRLILSIVVRREPSSWILAEYDVETQKFVHHITTHPILCRRLTADADGTIWCLGLDTRKREGDQDYDLVYQFDEAGTLLGSSLPRSTYADDALSLASPTCCREDSFLNGGEHMQLWLSGPNELIRFEPDGTVMDRLKLPKIEGQVKEVLAIAPDGSIFAMLISAAKNDEPETWTQALYRLSPDRRSWLPLQDPPVILPMRIELKAADEKGLILLDREALQLLWYPYDRFAPGDEPALLRGF